MLSWRRREESGLNHRETEEMEKAGRQHAQKPPQVTGDGMWGEPAGFPLHPIVARTASLSDVQLWYRH